MKKELEGCGLLLCYINCEPIKCGVMHKRHLRFCSHCKNGNKYKSEDFIKLLKSSHLTKEVNK